MVSSSTLTSARPSSRTNSSSSAVRRLIGPDLKPKAVLSGDWLPSGKFVIGDNFGAMYICQQTKPLCRIVAHEAMIGAIYVTPSANVITAGNDGHLKRWTV